MNSTTFNRGFFAFLAQSTTPFHGVDEMTKILGKAGFTLLKEQEKWQLSPGSKHFVIRDNGSLVAFTVGTETNDALKIITAHSDSPALQVKPKPDIYEKSYHRLGVEVYGSPLLSPWFDRELSLAGRVCYHTKKNSIHTQLIDLKSPIALIPSVAIHLDREANTQKSINTQIDIIPLIGGDKKSKKYGINDIVCDHLQSIGSAPDVSRILSFDLFLYDYHKPCYIGLDKEFILSSRLDNLLSCFVAAKAMAASNSADSCILVCNNHEEIGSTSAAGARGNLLQSLLQRLNPEHEKYCQVLADSYCISMDNAHALHPNHPEKHDGEHDIFLNCGPVLKINSNHKYATSSPAAAIFKHICIESNIEVQEFVMRNDMACGSTIGPPTSAKLGVKTVDIGAATLAMHSIRELTGAQDPLFLYNVIHHFLNGYRLMPKR